MENRSSPLSHPLAIAVWVAGIVIAILLEVLDRETLALRVLGGLIILFGAMAFLSERVPFRWEGQKPSTYITGWPLKLMSLAMVALGLALAAMPAWFIRV
ncbi:hypothetical protein [Piscinibacter defluvii]|uniref:hypothetical protein n=1 Tax=Piscinibacter defluvii TaxID=1796922 RepID=UPI000FDE481F|nr:hypothetical protein [Piscinibacter defluvii]